MDRCPARHAMVEATCFRTGGGYTKKLRNKPFSGLVDENTTCPARSGIESGTMVYGGLQTTAGHG